MSAGLNCQADWQRLNALNDFKQGQVDYLLATDLASRGLDIKGVSTVINYDMPGQLAQYTHRVGRTARAGRKGRSISLVGEADRKMLKAVIKQSEADEIRHRVIPTEAVSAIGDRMEHMKEDIEEVLLEEREEKLVSIIFRFRKHQLMEDETSRDGDQEGSEYGGARGGDLRPPGENLVPV